MVLGLFEKAVLYVVGVQDCTKQHEMSWMLVASGSMFIVIDC